MSFLLQRKRNYINAYTLKQINYFYIIIININIIIIITIVIIIITTVYYYYYYYYYYYSTAKPTQRLLVKELRAIVF